MAKYSKETIMCMVNRKDIVLVSNTETGKCKKYSNVEDIRGYMTYLLASKLEKVFTKIIPDVVKNNFYRSKRYR